MNFKLSLDTNIPFSAFEYFSSSFCVATLVLSFIKHLNRLSIYLVALFCLYGFRQQLTCVIHIDLDIHMVIYKPPGGEIMQTFQKYFLALHFCKCFVLFYILALILIWVKDKSRLHSPSWTALWLQWSHSDSWPPQCLRTWSGTITLSIVKKVQQRLYFLRQLRNCWKSYTLPSLNPSSARQ